MARTAGDEIEWRTDRLADAVERFGAVHLLCNNAGVEGYLDGAIWAATSNDWTWTVNVNFWSVVHGIRAFVPHMLGHGEPAHIVNTCSMTAVVSAANMFGITKHAVLALSEVLAADLHKRGARSAPPALSGVPRPGRGGCGLIGRRGHGL
jgi:NAD(P)-dependent dehydrogenase (short-subunit alcohol dehydrogenase family)